MRTHSRIRLALFVAAVFAATHLTFAQQEPLTATIPADPQITIGTLPNGLRYYVRANQKPEKRAELRLAINAGSILEEKDQLGLAHFAEHMAFNGTKNFPKQELVKFLEGLGMRFGADVNAGTSFDETTYMLTVPTDKPDVLEKSIQILEDWAHNVTFDPVEVDKERGVINEEWRLRRGAGARLQDKQFPILLRGSLYADRMPIGTMDVIQNFKHDRLKAFYTDWYRPDLMAVVAVGDFDKAVVTKSIVDHFSRIPKAASPKPRVLAAVPDHQETLYAIATDKEMPSTSVAVYAKMAPQDPSTIGAYRRDMVDRLFSSMLSARMAELAQKPDAPFMGAGTGRGGFVRGKGATSISALVKEDGIERGLEALFIETERVARFGFTATELDRQRQNILRSLERAVAEKDKQESGSLADEYVRNFTDREPIPGIVYEQALYQRFLPDVTLAEINALAKNWVPADNRVVMVSGPDKPGLVMPTEAKLAAAIASATTKTITAYSDNVDAAPLFDATPTPGTITKTATKDALGITEWDLSNGVKVVLKPTNFKADEILFRATSPGGTSLASDADFVIASTASSVVGAGGLGKLSSLDMRKAMAGKAASASAGIGELEEVVSGSGTQKDLELMFQLIYLRFTAPRADPAIFGVMTSQTKTMLANQEAQPEYAYYTTLSSVMTQDHLRAKPMSAATVDQMNLERSLAFYKDRFSDAGDFTFVFLGSFDVAAMKPLVEKYIASLPSKGRKETWKDVGMRPPTGVIDKTVEKGIEPKSQTSIIFSGKFPYNQEQRIAIRAMANTLQTRLRETLREDLGGTYSVSATANLTKYPREEYQLEIEFGSDPKRASVLSEAVFAEIAKLKTTGPTAKEVADNQEALLRDYEVNTKQNSYWLGQIALKYQYGEDPAGLLLLPDFYKKLSADQIKKAANDYLNLKNYVKVTLLPEKK
jgi:zinc protease